MRPLWTLDSWPHDRPAVPVGFLDDGVFRHDYPFTLKPHPVMVATDRRVMIDATFSRLALILDVPVWVVDCPPIRERAVFLRHDAAPLANRRDFSFGSWLCQ
jgi:hypothetical protein